MWPAERGGAFRSQGESFPLIEPQQELFEFLLLPLPLCSRALLKALLACAEVPSDSFLLPFTSCTVFSPIHREGYSLSSFDRNSLMDSVGEGEGGKIWENGIETCKISCMK